MADLTGTIALTLPIATTATAGTRYKLYPTSLAANTTLVSDTYLMAANCDCNSYKITFNCAAGNIVVKRSGDYYHTEQGAVDTINSSATNKVYWTVLNDDTIGTTLPGSTGSPAVSGGSWGNGTALVGTCTFNFWELRWADNKNFHSGAGILTISNFVFKNCAYSSVNIFYLSADANVQRTFSRIQFDNTNSLTGTSSMYNVVNTNSGTKIAADYIYIQSANTSTSIFRFNFYYNGGAGTTVTISYINITNAGTGAGLEQYNTQRSWILTNSRTRVYHNDGSNTVACIVTCKNCLFTDGATGIQSNYTTNNGVRLFNCVFKDLTAQAIQVSSTKTTIQACRNTIFDSNAKIVSGVALGLYGIKNNGYYNNTSEANWTRGPYDTTISAPSWGNFPSGTLHTDWTTYGPGDGLYTTQDIATGADTNSFCGIDIATQSHTGTTETLTTQRLGLAPVFASLA